MDKNQKLTISTKQLLASLVHFGHEDFTTILAKENEITKNELTAILDSQTYIIKEEKLHLQQDDLTIEEVINYLTNSTKKMRYERGKNFLNIYYIDDKVSLIEEISNQQHSFSIHNRENGFFHLLCDFYQFDAKLSDDPKSVALETSDEFYDHLLSMTKDELLQMILDEKLDEDKRSLLEDFVKNSQKVIQGSMIIVKKKKQEIVKPLLFIPGNEFVWHIDYENIETKVILFVSSSVKDYFKTHDKVIKDFFKDTNSLTQPPRKTKNKDPKTSKNQGKLFSFKRGIKFFIQSNLFFLITLVLVYVNKSSWTYDGHEMVLLYSVLTELFLMLMFWIACFRPVYK